MRHTRKRTHKQPWGYHLSVDAHHCSAAAIASKETIRAFITELVPAIDMTAYGAPRIVRFGTGNKEGYTLVQLIETSDITCHFAEDTGAAYLDVFSCKSFDPKVVMRVFRKHFAPTACKTRFFTRV
jgi:S-adenosylmethionine/arginine decarboxylase-like enzyme